MNRLSLADFSLHSQITPQSAEVFLELRDAGKAKLAAPGSLTLSGKLRGPFCIYNRTLPANYSLRPGILDAAASGRIPDFCCWSAENPFTYELSVEIRAGENLLGRFQGELALNWVELHHGKLYQGTKRWAPRIVHFESLADGGDLKASLVAVREYGLAVLIRKERATEAFLGECQKVGVFVAIDAEEPAAEELARWEAFGCVFLLICERAPQATKLLAVHRSSGADAGIERWGMLAARPFREGLRTPAELREACDRLQADAAGLEEWAGYLV